MMSPWLFNVHMAAVVQEVNVRVLGKELELQELQLVAGGRHR